MQLHHGVDLRHLGGADDVLNPLILPRKGEVARASASEGEEA